MAVELDPRLYGDPLQQKLEVPLKDGIGDGSNVGPAQRVQPIAGIEGSVPDLMGRAAQERADRERAGVVASFGAGMVSTDTAALFNTFTDPKFVPDATLPPVSQLRDTLEFTPSEDEGAYLDSAKSVEEWNFRASRVRDIRVAGEAGGDNPWAFLAGAIAGDPIYLASGLGSLGVASKFGKVAGVAAGVGQATAINIGVAASQPRSTEEIVFSMVGEIAVPLTGLNAAGKVVKKDPDFPSEAVHHMTPTDPTAPKMRWTAEGPFEVVPPKAPTIPGTILNPAVGKENALTRVYSTISEAAQDLAQNAKSPHIRQVMQIVAKHVPEGAVKLLDDADPTISAKIKAGVSENTLAVTASYKSGKTDILYREAAGQETLAHEVLHSATVRKLNESPELAASFDSLIRTISANLDIAPTASLKKEQAFFKSVFFKNGVPDVKEFLAYAMTSPSFQRMLDGMDSKGVWLVKPDAPTELTAFQKIAQQVAQWFGADTKAGKAFAQAMRAFEEHPAVRAQTLRNELDQRLSKMMEPVDPALHPTNHTFEEVNQAVTQVVETESKSWGKQVGQAIQWNVHRTMSSYGVSGKKIADLIVDNNMDLSTDSIEAIHRAVETDLAQTMRKYEDQLLDAMAEDGFGLRKQIFSPAASIANQQKLHDAVQTEMFRRSELVRQGRAVTFDDVPPRIKAMADSLDKVYKQAADELKAAGVNGAEELQHTSGFHNRRWSAGNITKMTDQFVAAGQSAKQAHQSVVRLVATSMRRANGWEDTLSYNVAAETVNRALRKGVYEDASFTAGGNELAAMVRDSLRSSGVVGDEAQRVLDIVVGKQDETGKAGFLKHRIEIDYRSAALVDGKLVRVTDLIDNNITDIVNKYIDGVSTQVAFARKGMPKASDITNLRAELMEELKRTPDKQREARDLFDGLIAKLRGEPVGTDMGRFLRNSQVFTRLVALPWSGLWQATEIATPMAKYGALKTIRHAVRDMPGFKQLLQDASVDPKTSTALNNVLTRMSSNNIRMRPFVQRLEDGYEVPTSAGVDMALQQAQQLIPYSNGLKWMHNWHANITGNLVTDVVVNAAKGDAKAALHLEKYGVTPKALENVREAVDAHGLDVDKWPFATWDAVRPAFAKMMDESVLHQRLGDTPEFALLNPVGKFIFAFRSFSLTAHNKVLSGTLGRDGIAGASLIMLYQFPLSALAVQAQAQINGKGQLKEGDLAARAVGQMGAMGLFTDVSKIINGDMQAFGSPAMIAVDRGIKMVGHGVQGDPVQAMKDGVSLVPLIGLPAKAIGAALAD